MDLRAQISPSVPLVAARHTATTVTDEISAVVLTQPSPWSWIVGFAIAFLLLLGLLDGIVYLLARGVGIWGVNIPVGWGLAIVHFVWWIGIGHAGTLISAILLLLRQDWRTSISRFAEAMTIFAVGCAGLYPIMHLGRPWLAYFLFPYPSTMDVWPNFRSPLIWDVFAVSTYATVSLLFWYVGLIPDLATLRDRSPSRIGRLAYGTFALGWRGSSRHWKRFELASLLLAGLATPLVVSVHTIVSFDFSVGIVPGWHSTIFPPYFVAGAVYGGFAMVLTLAIPLRRIYGIGDFVTVRHLDYMAQVMLATGLVVAYGYMMEAFVAWYGDVPAEQYMMWDRITGGYAPMYWALLCTNVVIPQLLWFGRVRTSELVLFAVAMSVNVGMWLERFVIVVQSLHRDFLPSSWGWYTPTFWDWTTFAGTLGLFFTLFLLFIRFLPMISIFELRTLISGSAAHGDGAPIAGTVAPDRGAG
jgi:Ni/Fe-hydrogenase subunit HybB-like protein